MVRFIKLFKKKSTEVKSKYRVGHDTVIMQPAWVDDNCDIGKYTYIGTHSNITKAKIGNYCSIGNFVSIGPGEHEIEAISTSTHFTDGDIYEQLTKKDVTIGHDVWIGTKAIIRRGVHVGNGAIIGANSFVNHDVPDFAIVAGTPAKIIRYRFNKAKIKKITNSGWWNCDLQEAKEIIKKLEGEAQGNV